MTDTVFRTHAADWKGWGTTGAPSLSSFTGDRGGGRKQLCTVCEIVPVDRHAARNHAYYTWFVKGGEVKLLTRVVGNGVDDEIPYTAIAMMLNP